MRVRSATKGRPLSAANTSRELCSIRFFPPSSFAPDCFVSAKVLSCTNRVGAKDNLRSVARASCLEYADASVVGTPKSSNPVCCKTRRQNRKNQHPNSEFPPQSLFSEFAIRSPSAQSRMSLRAITTIAVAGRVHDVCRVTELA